MMNSINSKKLYFSNRVNEIVKEILNYPLTIVEGPMGYGKTTLVREKVKELNAIILWQTIYDEDLSVFWKGFCGLWKSIDKERASRLLALGFPNDSTTRMEALSILDELQLEKSVVLVVDDYHIIGNEETNRFFEFLTKRGLPRLRLVIITRFFKMETVGELLLKGQLLHVKKELFELTTEDIKKYYRLCGISLREKEAEELESLTEGWISALYLIMLNRSQDGILDLSNDIEKLIENTVFRQLAEGGRRLLVSMSFLELFSLEQAEFICQEPDAKELLSNIIAKNAFVKYDRSSRNYQIHGVFRSFLQGELTRSDNQTELFRRAAQWFIQIGEYNHGLDCFCKIKDYRAIYRSLDLFKSNITNYPFRKDLLVQITTECEKEVMREYPLVVLIIALELYTLNETESFGIAWGEIHGYLQERGNDKDPDLDVLRGEFELLTSFLQYNDIRKMSVHHERACEFLKKPSVLLPINGIWTFGSPSIVYMLYREQGLLDDAVTAIFEALPMYNRATGGNGNGGEYCMKAEAEFLRCDFENALITSYQAIHKAKEYKQVANVICALFVQARISLVQGNYPEVIRLLEEMRKELEREKEYGLLHTIEMCFGYIYGLLSKSEKIPHWLAEGDYHSNRLLFPTYGFLNIIHGRALLLKGEYLRLIGSMEHFMGIGSVFPNLLSQLYVLIYSAAAYQRVLRDAEARKCIRQALDLAMPDRVFMPFVENGEFIRHLLEELSNENMYEKEIRFILEQYKNYHDSIERIKAEYLNESANKLTDRELEIGRLAVHGLTNKEIGKELFISANTVKMAIKSIYEKLSINNRLLLKEYLESIE